jgi:hypothetical protein
MKPAMLRAVALLMALCPCVVRASGFESGPRPSGAVFDPHGVLKVADRNEISAPLERILKDDGVEVIAVVLNHADVSDPEAHAKSLAVSWCESRLHAVVLHIPGCEGTPWIAAGGDLIESINPDELRDELAAVRRDASREPDDVSIMRTAANATADMLRYWKGREDARQAVIDYERTVIGLELETRAHHQQVLILTAAAAVIPIIIGAVLVFRLSAKNRRVTAGRP